MDKYCVKTNEVQPQCDFTFNQWQQGMYGEKGWLKNLNIYNLLYENITQAQKLNRVQKHALRINDTDALPQYLEFKNLNRQQMVYIRNKFTPEQLRYCQNNAPTMQQLLDHCINSDVEHTLSGYLITDKRQDERLVINSMTFSLILSENPSYLVIYKACMQSWCSIKSACKLNKNQRPDTVKVIRKHSKLYGNFWWS